MKKKFSAMLLSVCLIISSMTACNNSSTSNSTTVPVNKVVKDNITINFTDSAARQVKVPSHITRIVPSGALAQMALFALAPDMFVGLATKWDPVSKQYLDTKYYNLPVLGQFYGSGDLNLEQIAKVNPQVIIDVGESKSSIVKDMDGITKQVGIPTVHIEATSESMGKAYRMLGKLLGREKQAEVLAQYCEKDYSNTQNIMKKVGTGGKVKLLYCTGEDGLSVLAKGSFHSAVIDQVSDNVAVVKNISQKGSGNPVDMEQILLWDPEVIIFAPGSMYSKVAKDKTWQKLTAIKKGNYYEVPIGPYNWMGSPPSVNQFMGMIWITQLLYPKEAKYNAYEETAKYYKLFYHSKLTEAQYKMLVKKSLLVSKK
ncbi:ABC transporter substrate-binding protein [Clostridium estertheticum]|uniref:ABC transporter substrate-binding protein n=1 Tax=Clostridium estertheticum TaxID=238834 RepID=UPI001C6E73EC|nr:ABC transporter substrate-binding protein [Clostridium estertheticum]MBW9150732.1 ABC transporter substrate-binding protein [Clostridium estertheticum]WLC84535.1 ABC transporter substrate-binding protein [Clostridium estertheticum]